MIQLLSEPPAHIKRFRIAPWPFQQTFKTPLGELERFVNALSEQVSLTKCSLSTDEVVFEPRHLLELLCRSSITVENRRKFIVSADLVEEGASLLVATLSDWIDFCMVPLSERFAIYADHDEYITFYARDAEIVSAIRSRLEAAGFDPVDYVRQPSAIT